MYNTPYSRFICIATIRQDPSDTPSTATFSFSDTSAFPSGTSAPYPVPTGGQGSGAPILICYPVDSTRHSGSPNDATSLAVPSPSDPTPTSVPLPTISAVVPSDGQGSRGPIYICRPIDSSAAPSSSISASDAPSFSSVPTGTGIPQAVPTDGQGSGGSIYLQCRPVHTDPASISADPAPTPAPTTSASDA